MTHRLGIIDGFAANPDEIRRFALLHDFSVPPIFDGHAYPGFCAPMDPRFTAMYGTLMGAAFGRPVDIKLQAFVKLDESASTQQWIHSDNICASHASVHYLFDRPGHGTQFWRHREFAAHDIESIQADLTPEELAERLRQDGQSEDAWERTDYADSLYNRLIWYPARRFHSRANKTGFGSGDESRLILATFFNT